MTTIRDFMDQRQLTVYNKGDSHMKTEKSPVGELMFVPLNRKKVALAAPAKCLTAEHNYRLRMIEAAAAASALCTTCHFKLSAQNMIEAALFFPC